MGCGSSNGQHSVGPNFKSGVPQKNASNDIHVNERSCFFGSPIDMYTIVKWHHRISPVCATLTYIIHQYFFQTETFKNRVIYIYWELPRERSPLASFWDENTTKKKKNMEQSGSALLCTHCVALGCPSSSSLSCTPLVVLCLGCMRHPPLFLLGLVCMPPPLHLGFGSHHPPPPHCVGLGCSPVVDQPPLLVRDCQG